VSLVLAPSFLLVAVSVLVAAGCGGGKTESAPEPFTGVPPELQDPGPVHVHGLGYDRSSKTLYIATHTGLFELPPTARKARRIGDSHQDTMGFTLVEPKLFLGSGHPDARTNLPSHLGLIKSTDRGRTWQPLSLLGEADFHVLRSQGKRVYGFDSRSARLLASTDSGLTWTPRTAPEALVDVAVDPRDPDHLLASGGTVLYESRNGGRSWKAVASGVAGYLAWPAPDRAYLADLAGGFLSSPGAAGPWRSLTAFGSPAAALLAIDAKTLFVALHDGTIVRSDSGGATWEVRATP